MYELPEGCVTGNGHDYEEILSAGKHGGSQETVRWCAQCGSVVVDVDFDGRTHPGKVMNLRSPSISRAALRQVPAEKAS